MSLHVAPPPTLGGTAERPWRLPIQRSLPEMLAEQVVEAIRLGVLKPGERIVESRLARELGVSRGPLREALRALSGSGIVEGIRGRGHVVRRLSDDDLAHMITLRAGLEGLAARYVASNIGQQQIESLRQHIREMRTLAGDGRTADWRDHDWRFHETVVALSGNPHLLGAWHSISNLVRLFLHSHPGFVSNVPEVLANHDRMLTALASGDPDEAEHTFRTILIGSAFQRFGLSRPKALDSLAPSPGKARTRKPASRTEGPR